MPKSEKQTTEASFESALLNASAESALDAINNTSNAEALITAWVNAGNAAAVSEVAERGAGGARKAARRGINVLKSRGVVIPAKRTVTSVAGPAPSESFEAYMLAPDSTGTVLMVVAARTPTSRLRCAFVFVNESVGVQRVDLTELSQSQLKESLNNAIRGGDYKPVKVPVEWVRRRIEQARKAQKERGLLEPLGLSSAKALLEPVPAEEVEHPFDTEGLELADDDAKELAKNSGTLHALPEFRGWFPPGNTVDEMLARVGESLEAGQEPPAELLQQRLEEEVRAATDRYFTPERRNYILTLMKDSALSVLSREGEQKALEVAATMKVISSAGLITDPPHEIPFLRAFFDKAVGAMIAQGNGKLRIPMRNRPAQQQAGAGGEGGAGGEAGEDKPAEQAPQAG